MVAKPVTVGVVGVIVLASALVLNYFVLPGEESETATAVTAPPPPPAATAPAADAGPKPTAAPASSPATSPGSDAAAAAARTVPPKPPVSSEPSFDVVRVDPDGNAVLAGRAAPNAEIAIMDGGEEIGRVTTDSRGEWVFIPPSKLPPGQRVLFLRQAGAGPTVSTGEVSDSVVLVIPEKGKDIAGRPASEPSLPLVMVVPKEAPGDGGKVVARVLQAPAAGPLADPAPAGRAAASAGPVATSGRSAAAGDATSTPATSTPATSAPATSAPGGAVAVAAAAEAGAAGSARTASGSTGAGVTPPDVPPPAAGTGVPVAATPPLAAESPGPAATAGPSPQASAAASGAASGAPSGASASALAAGATAAAVRPGSAPATAGDAAPVVSAYPETAAGSAPRAGSGSPEVAVDVIDYDDKGDVVFSGRTDPGARVEVFIDDKNVGGTGADAAGRWTMRPEAPVAPGSYQLRVDKVAAGGAVEARVAFPFVRADPLTELPGNRLVVIQPGNNLWRIATRVYGSGVHYVEIFDANKDQILNPDLIYPGQVFGLPRTN